MARLGVGEGRHPHVAQKRIGGVCEAQFKSSKAALASARKTTSDSGIAPDARRFVHGRS